jgi:hypothetical protein
LLFLSNAHAATIHMDFTAAGFAILDTGSNDAPTDPVSGTLVWEAASVNATIDSLVSIDLTLNGAAYALSDISFESPFGGSGNTDIIYGALRGISTASFTDDFWIRWNRATLTGRDFVYTSSTLGGTWKSTNFTSFTVSEVPIPAAAWLFGSALLGLGVIKRRKA